MVGQLLPGVQTELSKDDKLCQKNTFSWQTSCDEKWLIISLDTLGNKSESIYFSFDNYKMPWVDVNAHHNLGSYQCSLCIFSTPHRQNLDVHLRRHNPEKLFKCNQCNYKGNQRVILNSHIRSTHNNLWYHCELCEYKASQKSNLKTHVQHKHKLHE